MDEVFSIFYSKNVNEEFKLRIFKIYFKRMSLYGAETWTTTERENGKLQP